MKSAAPFLSADIPMLIDNAMKQEFSPCFHFDTHLHRVVELLLCLSGCLVMTIQGEPVRVSEGEYIVIFPDVPHGTDVPPECPCAVLQTHFHSAPFTDLMDQSLHAEGLLFLQEISLERRKYLKCRYSAQLELCMQGLEMEMRGFGKGRQNMIELYLWQLNMLLSRDLQGHTGASAVYENRHLVNAIHFLHRHYAEKIAVEDVSSCAGVSTRYLEKLFEEHLGIGIAGYLTYIRISKAIELKYARPDYPLTDLAMDTGFGSPQHFSQVFKKKIGVSPRRYFSIQHTDL